MHVHELGLHTQFLGQLLDVKADQEVLDAGGMPEILILKILPTIFSTAGWKVVFSICSSESPCSRSRQESASPGPQHSHRVRTYPKTHFGHRRRKGHGTVLG